MLEKVRRRGLVSQIALTTEMAWLAACLAKPTQAPPPAAWPLAEIPIGLTYLPNIGSKSFPDIGLGELYLIRHEDPGVPLVGLGCLWGRGEPKQKTITAEYGFQFINGLFQPDTKMALTSRSLKLPNNGYGSATINYLIPPFIKEAERLIDIDRRSHHRRLLPSPISIWVRPYSLDELEYALVFGSGLITYQEKPSPLSFLAIRFKFPRAESSVGDYNYEERK